MNVYDFDNTIYRGESGVDLFLYYFRRDPKLISKFPMAIKAITEYKATKMSIDDVFSKYAYPVEEYCRSIEDMEGDIKRFWNINSKKIKPFYLKQRKDDDVILSACVDVVLEEICKRLNIKNFIGSEFDRETCTLTNFCYKENKVKAFKERYPDAVIENFYTDSYNDLPMIDLAQNAYIVKGDKITKIK